MSGLTRRRLLQAALGGASALVAGRRAAFGGGQRRARRVVVFYFPDGVPGRSQSGQPGEWDCRNDNGRVVLSQTLEPLGERWRDCLFPQGLHMGTTDEGSHPGGARKLLTGRDGGNGESVDQWMARTLGRDAPFRHLYLGAMATANNASGDKFISYPSAGMSVAPDDDPVRAFGRLFSGGTVMGGGGSPGPAMPPPAPVDDDDAAAASRAALGAAEADLLALREALAPSGERARVEQHLEALREVQQRVARLSTTATPGDAGVGDAGVSGAPTSCASPRLAFAPLSPSALHAPENFPAVLRAQIDVAVQAMACGLTRVSVIQASQHTSELIMSRFMGSEMYDPGFDMRSHQASHYGAQQDQANRLYRDFVRQRRWFVAQFAYLLEQLRARPEDGGTMLDHTVALLCSEVSDGNTHSHAEMPFVLAGRAGGAITPGRVLDGVRGRRHGDLLATLAQAMGGDVQGWGDASGSALPGVLG